MSIKRTLRSGKSVLEKSKVKFASNNDDGAENVEVLKKLCEKPLEHKADMRFISTRASEHLPTPVRKKARLASPEIPVQQTFSQNNAAQNRGQSSVPLDRPAESHHTNAPLRTPRRSRLITYSEKALNSTPSKNGFLLTTTSTMNLLEQACNHLTQLDSRFKSLIEKNPCPIFSPEGLAEEIDPFQSLCSGIISQQVSGAAAKSIKSKFTALFQSASVGASQAQSRFPLPAEVAASELPRLRQAGLSQRKAEYIKGLAKKFVNGELSAETLVNARDEEVLERLTAVRGLGKWSVEMFACFCLKRMDVFSTSDLGVQYTFWPAYEMTVLIR